MPWLLTWIPKVTFACLNTAYTLTTLCKLAAGNLREALLHTKGSGALESRTLPCRLELPVGMNLRSAPALDSDHPRLTTLVRHTIGLATAGKFLLLLKYSLTLSSNVILRWDLAQRKREESLL